MLTTILQGLPSEFPAAVVIVLHRAPDRPSQLTAILQRASRLPVRDAVDGDHVTGGTVYVARPDLHLTLLSDGSFRHVDGRRIRHVRSSANPLFESAAAAFGPRVIAVLLSGHGHDGTDGVQCVRDRGGSVIVQDPAEAMAGGMATSAIRTGAVECVLPVAEIAPELVRRAARLRAGPPADRPSRGPGPGAD